MNNTKHRFLTLLLAFVMLFTTLPLNVFAASGASKEKNEITDIKTVGDKQVINLGEVQGKSRFDFFSRSSRLFKATARQASSSNETVAQKVEINLETLGLNLGDDEFDPSALTEAGSFDVNITFKEVGGRKETRTMTFQAGETKKTETFYLPKDFGNGNVEAEIPKLKDTISLRVYVGANSTTNFTLGDDMSFDFELTQIIHPVIDLKVVDPYGKELQESINQKLGLKLALEEEHDFNLPANTKTFNIRTLADFAGDNVADLNEVGANPTLSLTTKLDENNKLKVGDKTYKLNKITYNALGQEVVINDKTEKVGGHIEFATQPKIVVPTPDENGDLPETPDGYKRLSFHAESSSNAQDGRFEHGDKLKVIDVLEGTEYTDKDLQKEIKGIGQPTPLINGRVDDNKKFLKWNPALPTEGKVADTDYWPVYLKDGGEITPGEKLPDGVFEVKVIKDDTIAKDALYGKSYGVFQGSKLARDKFPDLEAAKGHQNPKWTTEAEDPAKGMVDIEKPWTKVIQKATTFKATAGEDAATQIGKDGLKAVDTTALQGQELTEAFWHKGVALADNTPADKKDAFAALLKEATVTDKSSRTTDAEGTFPGTLLVTFKDGSTLEVEKQNLIVKPNTVTVEFDKAEGKEHPLRDGDTTVKGKISASSNSDEFPVSLDGALVTIKKGDTVLSRTIANEDGSFVAGVKEPLVAGEDISVVVTLPGSKTASKPVTEKVQLNPDKLNEIIPTGEAVVKNLKDKKGVDQTKVAELENAIKKATDDLVNKDGKVKSTVEVDATGQKSLDDQYEAIKKAIEALTGNTAPEVTGTSHKEIFKGDALDLEEGIKVTDKDGEKDIALQDGKKFSYKVEKIGEKGAKEAVKDTATINQTPGTYEVTYTAKDKSGAEGTFVMTLVVKNNVIEVPGEFPEDDKIPEGYVKVEFKKGAHGTLEGTTKFLVKEGSAKTVLNAPTIKPNANYEAKKDANWDPAIPPTFADHFETTAQYTYTGDDVVEQKPGEDKPDVPENFVKVEFKKGDHGVISSEETTIYWVNPEKEVTLTAPAVTPSHGYKHTGWNPEVQANTKYTEAKEFVAQYKATVVTEDPNDKEHYAKVEFLPGDKGSLEGTTTFWVWKGETVSFDAPKVTANENYKFKAWNPEIQETYTEDTQHTATYESTQDVSDTEVEGFQEVKFVAGKDGKFEGDKTEKSVWVKPDTLVDLTDKAPKVIANEGKVHTGWSQKLIAEFTKSETPTEITAQYKTDADNNGIADEDEKTPEPDVLARNIGENPDKTTVEVETEPKAKVTIEYTDKDGQPQKVENLTAGEDGKLTQEITPMLKDGTDVKVTVQDGEKKPADKTVKVFDDVDDNRIPDDQAGQTERPAAIASNKGKTPTFTTIEGKTEKGATITVTVKVNGEEKPVTVENLKVNDDGTYTLEAKYNGKPLENGAEILVYAENAPKTKSAPQTTTVFNDFNNDGKPDGGKVDLNDVKDIQVIAPNKMSYTEGDKLDGTGLKAVVRDNKGGIEIFEYDNEAGKFKDADGKAVDAITATVADKAIKNLALTEKDHDGKAIDVKVGGKKGSTNQTLEVKQLQTPTPTIEFAANQNTVGSDGKTPTGTAKQKTTVKFTVKNKPTKVFVKYTVNGAEQEETFEIGANDDATKTVDLQVKLPVGAEVQVLAKDADKTLSEAATEKVVRDANNDGTADDKTPVGKTEIDPIKAESESITVKPADNATELVIKETDKSGNTPEGSKEITVKKDGNGNWTIDGKPVEKTEDGKLVIPTKDKLKLDEYNVVEVEAKGDPDTTTPSTARETVGEAADTTAPEKPVVDTPVDGDKDIKVKTPTDKDAKTITVEVEVPGKPGEDPTTKTVVVEKDDDGKWKTTDGKDVPEENGKLVIPVDPAVKTGDKVVVEVKDDSGNASKSDPQTVVERKQLPVPTIDPIKTGERTVSGTAKDAATVDIYKKNAQGEYDLIKGDVGVSADGSYTYNHTDGFKDGDVIRVVAKKPGMTPNNAETTVGVDTSGLDKAIQDGKDALDPEKGGKNNGTPEDKALEDAIKKGEEEKNKKPPKQQDVDKAQKDIEKAIDDKKKADEARDKLQEKINEANDKKNDPEYPTKPEDVKEDLDKAATDGQKVHDDNNKSKEDIDKEIEKIQEKLDQYNKQQIGVNISKVISTGKTIKVVTTAPNAKVEVFKVDFDYDTLENVLTPLGEATSITRLLVVSLDETLPKGTNLLIKVTHPDYLSYEDNITVE